MAASRACDSDRKLKYMQAFQSLGPPTYAGNSDFVEAEDWLRRVTKCMDAIDVPVELRVTLAAFMLTGEAERWWEFAQRGRDVGSMTWEDFERRFQRMYFPNDIQCSNKSGEFYDLTQGDMTVAQYVAKFIQLSRYATFTQTEDLKIKMFIRGLNPCIKLRISVASEFNTCEDAVNRALSAESFEEDWKRREETSDCEASGSGGKLPGVRVHLAATDTGHSIATSVAKPVIFSAIVLVIHLLLRTTMEGTERCNLQGEVKVRP